MAGAGQSRALLVLVAVTSVWVVAHIPRAVNAQQFKVIHKYAHSDPSIAKTDYFETLKAHDRRRLASVLELPLEGSYRSTGLYYTQLSLGTPPVQYSVFMDTGSHVTWVNCVPCTSCPSRSTVPGVTLTLYDPRLSSTAKVLPCDSPDCRVASYGNDPVCTDPVSPGACTFEIQYVDGSSYSGYFLNDVMTFDLVANGTSTTNSAEVYFGCGHNQSFEDDAGANVDGLMGLGQQAIAIPMQLANQKKTSRSFAHCLQGDNTGGGIFVIGDITEPDVVYTPILPRSGLYNAGLLNIEVNGTNCTTPATFDIKPDGSGGVALDSGSTLALLMQPAYDDFESAVARNAPVPLQQIPNLSGSKSACFVYSGSMDGAFPEVKLIFDGGAVMNLGPTNYLFENQLSTGETAYCIAWYPNTQLTILGDIVLKDQLIVYDNDNERVGWKPFDCTKRISVGNSTNPVSGSTPKAQAPGSPRSGGPFSAARDSRTRISTYLLSTCLAFAFLRTLL